MAKTKIVENPMKDLKPQSWLGKGLYVIGSIGVLSWGYHFDVPETFEALKTFLKMHGLPVENK